MLNSAARARRAAIDAAQRGVVVLGCGVQLGERIDDQHVGRVLAQQLAQCQHRLGFVDDAGLGVDLEQRADTRRAGPDDLALDIGRQGVELAQHRRQPPPLLLAIVLDIVDDDLARLLRTEVAVIDDRARGRRPRRASATTSWPMAAR